MRSKGTVCKLSKVPYHDINPVILFVLCPLITYLLFTQYVKLIYCTVNITIPFIQVDMAIDTIRRYRTLIYY